ncbi:hypothetical protein [Helicobacter hepaticus]|jgi:hypothetical protein|uniref:Periplasmic protein n=1 Tax=Helicobacter hepaticus (strain ATCC 51449 / 3B1) TaxID=235279 RepID=Q7VIX6_HELHP|nr:hypothetical protein [Helicobacter hepaticus]AAP77073.1 hypothetical protein HH_0476 [Helicobacter hepaticus ATCC 51449]
MKNRIKLKLALGVSLLALFFSVSKADARVACQNKDNEVFWEMEFYGFSFIELDKDGKVYCNSWDCLNEHSINCGKNSRNGSCEQNLPFLSVAIENKFYEFLEQRKKEFIDSGECRVFKFNNDEHSEEDDENDIEKIKDRRGF